MVICADTSFLFSLYANDAHSRQAVTWVAGCRQPLSISLFNEHELGNALRFAEFRKLIPSGMAASYWAQFETAIAQNRLQMQVCNLAMVLVEAQRLSSTYTLRQGHRSFDILHVAVARHIGATDFLTFDSNQSRLAQAEGLTVPKMR
jgi:predicted nucleic acid-binding protein